MKLKLIKLTKEYYNQLKDMIDEWKLDQEVNRTNHSPWAIFKNDYQDFDYYLDNLEIKEPVEGKYQILFSSYKMKKEIYC